MRLFEIRDRFGLDALQLGERPRPEPGPGQALVKMRAFSLNYRDLLMVKGLYNPRLPLPRIPLSDGAGEVEAVGEGVRRLKRGDRVATTFFQRWLTGPLTEEAARSDLGGSLEGVLAEYVALHEDGLVEVPPHLSDEEAATLPCAGVTAWNALVVEGRIKAGDTVLVLGTGGVSLFALQLARIAGLRVIATSGSDEKLRRALELGASEGINYRTTPDWEKRVLALTGGSGVELVIEVGGAGTLGKSLRAVRVGGTIALIGILSGSGEVNPLPAIMRGIRIQGIFVGSRAMFEAMNHAIGLHRMRPVIDRVFRFEEAREALRHMESGAHFGKVVLKL